MLKIIAKTLTSKSQQPHPITNLTSYQLTSTLLEKALTFRFTTSCTPPKFPVDLIGLQSLATNLNPNSNIDSLYTDLSIEPTFSNFTNLSPVELTELKTLASNPDIIIKKADKGGGTVLYHKNLAIFEGKKQLSDSTIYKPIPHSFKNKHLAELKLLLASLIRDTSLAPFYKSRWLTPTEKRERFLYFIPKTQKPKEKWGPYGPPCRPVVSGCNSITDLMEMDIQKCLTKFLKFIPNRIQDSFQLVNKLKTFTLPPTATIITGDLESLYTNIPHKQGIDYTFNFLSSCLKGKPLQKGLTLEALMNLLSWSLQSNDFYFNGEFFVQIEGTAMGKRYAPAYADLFLHEFDLFLIEKINPIFYCRYIDDTFIVLEKPPENLIDLQNTLNSWHPKIKITLTEPHFSQVYLDLKIWINKETNKFEHRINQQPYHCQNYLFSSSGHPRSFKNNIIQSLVKRTLSLTSKEEHLIQSLSSILKQFTNRKYNLKIQLTNLIKAFQKTEKRPKPKNIYRLPFDPRANYFQQKQLIKKAILKHTTLDSNSFFLTNVISVPSIANRLVRAQFPRNKPIPFFSKPYEALNL